MFKFEGGASYLIIVFNTVYRVAH